MILAGSLVGAFFAPLLLPASQAQTPYSTSPGQDQAATGHSVLVFWLIGVAILAICTTFGWGIWRGKRWAFACVLVFSLLAAVTPVAAPFSLALAAYCVLRLNGYLGAKVAVALKGDVPPKSES
jgi:hypothetical protein